jgi:2-polyprenyl-6-hydroxyphenyl methylase/3-demethylubiquinone-9 3-methyltransferase
MFLAIRSIRIRYVTKRRFAFGKNWLSYTKRSLNGPRLTKAVEAFERLFAGIELKGRSFLDVGFGQGLTTAIAASKGCKVMAIDIDPDNIKALQTTAEALGLDPSLIQVQVASILDESLVARYQDHFDIVHSWGVLHHTGQMETAIANTCRMVRRGGYLIIAIYNRHWSSPFWKGVKYTYNICPGPIQRLMVLVFYPIVYTAKWLVTGKDPYEYASIDQVRQMVEPYGFTAVRIRPAGVPTGCNEFIFRRG